MPPPPPARAGEGRTPELIASDDFVVESQNDIRTLAMRVQTEPVAVAIDVGRVVSGYGCRHLESEHPFVAYFRQPDVLATFFGHFQPATVAQAWYPGATFEPSDPDHDGAGQEGPLSSAPWLNHPESWHLCGPAARERIAAHRSRLDRAMGSIRSCGYLPGDNPITGHFLAKGDDYVFCIRHGRHRAAVLAALGCQYIPVVLVGNFPRLIEAGWLSDARDRMIAEAYFDPRAAELRRALMTRCLNEACASSPKREHA